MITELPLGRLIWTFQHLSSTLAPFSKCSRDLKAFHCTDNDYRELATSADEFGALCLQSSLDVTYEAATLFCADLQRATKVDSGWTFDLSAVLRCENSLRQLIGCLRNEAKTKVAMILPPGKMHLYAPPAPLWGDAIRGKFPSAMYDVNEAGKCLALGRASATVFHLMHIVEIALRAVHACLGLTPPDNPSWGIRLKDIRDERVRRGDRSWSENDYFQDIYSRLDAIKDAYRDPTIHVETIHTEEEADLIFKNTEALMKKIASRMDENGEPKA